MSNTRKEIPLLIAFVDLARYSAQSQHVTDTELAETINEYYERIAESVEAADGIVVKYIGDAALLTFPEDAVDRGVEALLELKESIDRYMLGRGWECRLRAKAHFGTAVAGPFGPSGSERFDVVGKAVNTAATLAVTGVTLSVSAFRKLSPGMRRHFKKHTPGVTYIRQEDRRVG